MIVKSPMKNLKYWTRVTMGSYALLYDLLPNRWNKVSPQKDMCIEGFPRSANSFFVGAFRTYNPAATCAHHMHAPMQVVKAAEYDIPCVVLIRNPIDAIASVLVVDRRLSIGLAIKSYISFYERVWPVRKTVVIADFQDATQRPHRVVDKVNRRYSTSFKMEPLTPSAREYLFARLREAQTELNLPEHLVAVPTEAKAQIKKEVLPLLSAHPLLPAANRLYQQFLSV